MTEAPISRDRELHWVRTDQIVKNPRNPRQAQSMKPELLEDLRRSIRTHGILEPLIVMRYDEDMYLLLEGERRYHSAKLEGIKEIPVIVVNDLKEHDQVVVMYNIHTQRKGWEKVEELLAIQKILAENGNGDRKDVDIARELGISVATFRDRLAVLNMGPDVLRQIGKGEIEYSSALRADQVARTLVRSRPELVERLGGESEVEKALINKARTRGVGRKGQAGIAQELVQARSLLADPGLAPDVVVQQYLEEPAITWKQVAHGNGPLEQQRKADSFSKSVSSWLRDVRSFNVRLEALPNLPALRSSLSELIEAASQLEERVVEEMLRRRN